MKHTKRFMSIILSFVMLLSITAGIDFSAYAKILTSGPYEYVILDNGTAKITSYAGSGKDICIPATIGGYSVTNIGLASFSDSEIISVTIPNTVTEIGSSAFERCSQLQKVTIGSRVKTIDKDAFRNCSSLKSIIIPDSVTLMDNYAFADCDELTNVTLSKNLSKINSCTFKGCNIGSIIIPDNITDIGSFAFEYCSNMTSVKIGSKVTKIDDWAFYGCYNLKDVYYVGNKKQWENIFFGDNNERIIKADIHYNCDCKHSLKTTITKATTKKNGSIVTKCSVCGTVKSKSTIYYPKTITLSTTSYTYNGKTKKPSVTIKDAKGKKIDKKYYTVSYSSGRKNVGKYTVTVKFKGKYSGTVKKTFTIKPKATTISKVAAGRNAFTVKWKKQATQTTGYQIQYSTSSKFKGAKTVTVSKNKTTSKKISKLKAKKKYYVRIRTYKTVKINGKNTKIYSGWSKVKTVKTK